MYKVLKRQLLGPPFSAINEKIYCGKFLFQLYTYEASDSITDGARGLVGKRGDTAMRERFFSFK